MFNEERVVLQSGELKLEGLLANKGHEKGVVILHPNPLMGGSMHNNVVECVVEAFNAKNYATLRFNFRGVGRSQGFHTNGIGEVDDLVSAISYLESREVGHVGLAGYSFGSAVTASYLKDHDASGPVILVSPPISVYSLLAEGLQGKVDLIVCGDRDPFCAKEEALRYAQEVHAKIVFMERTDHFFVGKEQILTDTIQENLI